MTHGGFRAGAGRKPRLRNKNAAAFGKLARDEAHDIVAALIAIATKSENETARFMAIRELLTRAYGAASPPLADDREPRVIIYHWSKSAAEAFPDPARGDDGATPNAKPFARDEG
jgi:hypothetical protein